jgi:predicted peroxiredoxin
MAKTLGIFVSSDKHLDKIIKICKAAKKMEIDVNIFFTHLGTLLSQDSRFGELRGLANMAICKVGFESHGLKPPVEGIGNKGYGTQARHGEIIDECDRYLVF